MPRYIDADALIAEMQEYKYANSCTDFQRGVNASVDILSTDVKYMPTADVAEVKHGEWREHFAFGCWHYDCPFCEDGYAMKEKDNTPPNYCQNCGAKMDREREK